MTHYTVLVIGEDPEEQLKPFDENLEMERYVRDTKEQLIAKGKKEMQREKEGNYADYLKDPKKYTEECKNNERHLKYISEEFPKKLKWTDEEIYQDQIQFVDKENIGEDGEVYSTYNPNSKWDWYQLGGRWTGAFKLKANAEGVQGEEGIMTEPAEEGTCDQAKKGDIDFSIDQKEIYRAIKFWELRVEDREPMNEEEKKIKNNFGYNKEYYLSKYKTKEVYAIRSCEFTTYAVLKDGV